MKWLFSILAAAVLSACVTSPTGRAQFMLISPEAAIVESRKAYAAALAPTLRPLMPATPPPVQPIEVLR